MSGRFAYLDTLLKADNNDDDEECYDWDTSETKKPQVKVEDTKPAKVAIKKPEQASHPPVDVNWDIMVRSYTNSSVEDHPPSMDVPPKGEGRTNMKAMGNIMRWNKRNQDVSKDEWDAIGEEFHECNKKLDHINKRVLKGNAVKRGVLWDNVGPRKIISLIEDFSEKIIQPPWFVCVICRRQFNTTEQLEMHCRNSLLHIFYCRLLSQNDYVVTGRTLSNTEEKIDKAIPTEIPNMSENVGTLLLKGMGWKEGETLGITPSTIEFSVSRNDNRAGIGADGSRLPLHETPLERARRIYRY